MIAQLIFFLLFIAAITLFIKNVRKIIRNINLGLPVDRSDRKAERWKIMFKVAFGQTKMFARPIPAILHFTVYAGFIIINIEVLEIIIDGLFGTHRILAPILGSFYNFIIASFEWLALGVILACIVFLIRRNAINLRRFSGLEMTKWPKSDANLILIIEILLMSAFLKMNAADLQLQQMASAHYVAAGAFPVSSMFASLMPQNEGSLILIERICWWFHIIGIFAFLNYLPYSKHLHIVLAFPNTWFSKLEPKGELNNMPAVTNEVKAMLDPSYLVPPTNAPARFGAKDVNDLSWKSLMEAYTCTECGRCTSECPANITGKLLSPRKIMMDTRDRLTELGNNIDIHGKDHNDGKSLLDNYISREEIWACTSCNACTMACPVNIDPLAIILELRRYIVMEESKAPASLNTMFGNVENNGAPWKYSPADRLNWGKEG